VADTALKLEQRIERCCRQRLQLGPLGDERLGDDSLRGAVHTRVGDGREPVFELGIEIVEIAEASREEEVLPDVAERSLDLALGLGAVRPARPWMEAVMLCERQQRSIIDDAAIAVLACHGRLHAVVKDFDRHAADRRKSLHMAAQQRLQVLMHYKAGEDESRMAEHHREEPNDTRHAGLVSEDGHEAGKIHLRLLPGRRLKSHLERLRCVAGTYRSRESLHGRM
jgi:hypothetical protein